MNMVLWEKIFVFLIAILPLISWYGIYEGAKIAVFWVGGLILIIFWLFNKIPGRIRFDVSDLFYFLWLLTLAFSTLSSPFWASKGGMLTGLVGGGYRHQGVVFFFILWLMGKTLTIITQETSEKLYKALSVVILVESLIVIVQEYGIKVGDLVSSINGRPLGTLGEPNATSGFLAIGFVFLTSRLTDNIRRVAMAIFLFVAILLTQSLSGLIAFSIVVLGAFYQHIAFFLKLNFLKKILFIPLIFFLVFVVTLSAIKLTSNDIPSRFESRTLFWKIGIEALKEKPLVGYGLESQEFIYNKWYSRLEMPLQDLVVERSHNLFIDLFLWSGIPGLLLFIGWIISRIRFLWVAKNILGLFGVVGWFAFSSFQPVGVVHWLIFMIVLYSGVARENLSLENYGEREHYRK